MKKWAKPSLNTHTESFAQAQVLFKDGLALQQKGQLAQAFEIYQQVLKLQPGYFDALHLSGVIGAITKNLELAREFFERAIEVNPSSEVAHYNLGNVLNELKIHQLAIDRYSTAIAINQDFALAYCGRGNALRKQMQHQAAIASYDLAIAIKPDFLEAIYNRGNTFRDLKQHQAALYSYDLAIAFKPDLFQAYANRGNALADLKQYEAAIESYDKALAISPDHAFLFGARLSTKMLICDWTDVENEIAELTQRIQRSDKSSPALPVLALTSSLSLQRKVAEIWANEMHPVNFELGSIPKRARGEKIRIAYFSMDFEDHPVSFLTAGLIESHDRTKFEVYAFSFGPDTKDEMRIRLEAAFDKFIDVQSRSDKEIAELARRMQIDIAIDLGGFTKNSRTGIFALRAAPLQINYLGYPGTMGADYMDYLIADKQLIPQEVKVHYAEKIVYLPSFQANDNKRGIADKVFTREELGLPQSGFVFCCFNNSYKITPSTFDGWMRILKRVDGSVLWLSEANPSATENLRKEAKARGVDTQRLVFARKIPLLAEHLARHRAADLFIDTLPYNAHTTASDALWAGLPVLTCTGEALASRVAASLLTAIDLPELVTTNQEDYEVMAVELATNPERLKVIKEKLERNRLTAPLFDTKLFTRHIEDAYTQMYERYCADLAPDHIYVG